MLLLSSFLHHAFDATTNHSLSEWNVAHNVPGKGEELNNDHENRQ